MKNLFLIGIFMLFSFISNLSAQADYNSAIGLRLGYPTSISYKTFIDYDAAIEGYIGWRDYSFGNYFSVSGAYQKHKPFPETEGLQWYFGGGASLYFWGYEDEFKEVGYTSTSFGVQGYLGLDYKFLRAPINISLDWVPTFFLGSSLNINTFGGGFGGLTVRYVID